MAVEGQYFAWTLPAGENLDDFNPGTGTLFKAVSVHGRIANNGEQALGILVYGAEAGELVTLGYMGVLKFVAGADIKPGQPLTVAEGGVLIPARRDEVVVGRCLDTAVKENSVGTGIFNFSAPRA